MIADATRNERAHANGNDLLEPGVLFSTRLDILSDHEVVLLVWNRLSSQKAGSQPRNIGEIAPLRHIKESTILSLPMAAGVGMYLLSSVFFIAALRKGELSVLYPLVSLGYIWTLLWSNLFFKEPLTRHKFLGLFLILVGVSFIGMGNR